MRMMKKGGAPCDRRIDRRKVAIAAAAVLLMSVATVQANSVTYQVIPSLTDGFGSFTSHISVTGSGYQFADGKGNPSGPFLPNAPQKAAGNGVTTGVIGQTTDSADAPIVGYTSIDTSSTPGSFTLLSGSGNDMSILNTAPVGGTGWSPGKNGAGQPNLPPNAPSSQISQWGTKNTSAGVVGQNQTNTRFDWNSNAAYQAPNDAKAPPLGLGNGNGTAGSGVYTQPSYTPVAGMFTFSGNQLIQTSGFADVVSASGNSHSNFAGTIVRTDSGTGGAQTGYYDAALSALILPVNFSVTFPIISGGIPIAYVTSVLTGTIILAPVVPEPSTVLLMGFGVVGLLSYAWRVRKRKASIA